jgi:hypothetical protein
MSYRASGRESSKKHRSLALQRISDPAFHSKNVTKDKKEHD